MTSASAPSTTMSKPNDPQPADPEVVEVDVERLGERRSHGQRLLGRFRALALPALLALLIDAGDAVSIPGTGAIALPFGLLAGYLFSGFLQVAPTWRVIITVITGIYWATPFTGMIPMATIIAIVGLVFDPANWKEEPFS